MKEKLTAVLLTAVTSLLLLSAADVLADGKADNCIVKYKSDSVTLYSDDLQHVPFTDNLYLTDTETAELLKENGLVECIAEDCDVELFDAPNDAYYSEQWSLTDYGYTDIYERGLTGEGVRIGIIDSGVYLEHPELQGRVSDESYNIISQSGDCTDEYGHGTFVTGLIGAASDNGIGISGIAPGADLIMIKCFDSKTTKLSYIISALNYASELNLDVLNLSFGVSLSAASSGISLLQEAVDKVFDSGATVVASVGNKGTSTLYYPAAFDNVIGVGAVNNDAETAPYSQHNESVFITAPGSNIYGLCSPKLDSGLYYKYLSGTSMSAPYVAAAVALVKEKEPDISFDGICKYLKMSVKDNGENGYDTYYGWGVFNPKVFVDNVLGGTRVYVSEPEVSYDNEYKKITLKSNTINKSEDDISIIYAFYTDGIFKEARICDFKDKTVIENIDASTITEIKCFIWNSTKSMKPFYKKIHIDLS